MDDFGRRKKVHRTGVRKTFRSESPSNFPGKTNRFPIFKTAVKVTPILIKMKKHSWKTTLGGVLQSIGLPMTQLEGTIGHVGTILAAVGALLLGLSARDNRVTSEQADAG